MIASRNAIGDLYVDLTFSSHAKSSCTLFKLDGTRVLMFRDAYGTRPELQRERTTLTIQCQSTVGPTSPCPIVG